MKAQTAMEYLLIVGAAILFVTIVIFMIRGSVLPPSEQEIETGLSTLQAQVSGIMPE